MNLSWDNTGIPVSYRINGQNIREKFGIELSELPKALMPSVRRRDITPAFQHGVVDAGALYGPREFALTGVIMATTHANAVTYLDGLRSFMRLEDNYNQFFHRGRTIRGVMLEIVGHGYDEPRLLSITYAGGGTVSPIGRAARGGFKLRAFDFSMNVRASYPFWVSVPKQDVHRGTGSNDWLRLPKDTSALLGTAATSPEFQFSGPIESNSVTIAHGAFGVALRFRQTAHVASSDALGIVFDTPNIYGTEKSSDFHNRIALKAITANEGAGSGEAACIYGESAGANGAVVKIPIRRSDVTLAPPGIDAQDQDFINGNRGSLSCFFKPVWDYVDGDSDDERTHTLLSIGKASDTSNQLRFRFSRNSSKMKMEQYTINASGTTLSTVNAT